MVGASQQKRKSTLYERLFTVADNKKILNVIDGVTSQASEPSRVPGAGRARHPQRSANTEIATSGNSIKLARRFDQDWGN